MESVEIKEDIYWVGSVDWSIRNFHGYSTHQGTTYNTFLAVDEKTVLFDTVKRDFLDDLLYKIGQVTQPEKIDYLVVDHVELDHAGSLPEVVDRVKPEKIFCSPMGEKALRAHFHREDWPCEAVKTGDEISIGKRTIRFIETRMLHWPDSMCSYIKEDRLLISNDIFGQHWATSERFDDEVDLSQLIYHAAKYFANIILPYSPRAVKLLKDIRESGMELDMLATDHGLIWRKHIPEILKSYETWARQETKSKALIIFDSMWHSTETMAKSIADGLLLEGVSVRVLDLKANSRDDIMEQALDAKGLVFGSPTLNNGMMPLMADVLSYMKGLKPVGRIGAAFGSYGWGGEAVKLIEREMEEMKMDIPDPGIRVNYVPTEEDLKRCVELGRKIGKAIKEKT